MSNTVMQRFFDTFSSIDLFTLSLDHHQDKTQCAHCLKNNQFISHGIIYKQTSIAERKPVGKRIICSNRYGRSGCGRTVQLYVSNRIPRLHYDASVVFAFISLLLAKVCVTQAYQQATGQFEARHAWRWLSKLMRQLSAYRGTLISRTNAVIEHQSKRLRLLLPTLTQMIAQTNPSLCAFYQVNHQRAFM
jgi:hypothetical protein